MADEASLPMDKLDDAPLPSDKQEQERQQERARDESGRFAPKQPEGEDHGQPRGKPDEAHARRREAQERDEARRRAEDAEARYNALQKRLDDMAALAKGETPEDQKPDPLAKIVEKVEGIDKRLSENDQRTQEEQAWNQVRSYADQDEARFVQEHPDFPNALQHYITSRIGEMQALGLAENEIGGALQQEAATLLVTCAQQNRSPAQAMYEMAKARGYSGTLTGSAGARPAPAPAGGRSFGTAHGAAATGGITLDQIGRMSEEDYTAFRSTPEGRRTIERLMAAGG
jgi:hypothetical protein